MGQPDAGEGHGNECIHDRNTLPTYPDVGVPLSQLFANHLHRGSRRLRTEAARFRLPGNVGVVKEGVDEKGDEEPIAVRGHFLEMFCHVPPLRQSHRKKREGWLVK